LSLGSRFCVSVLSLAAFAASSSGSLPTAEDVEQLAQEMKQTAEAFSKESIELRFQHEYSGRFLSERDRERLEGLAKRASDKLIEIADSQEKLKKQIEEYEGGDWDQRYGETGLWRRLFADIYATNVSRCEIDLHSALCAKGPIQGRMLRGVLARIKSLSETHDAAYLQLLKARVLGLLDRGDTGYGSAAAKEFDLLSERSDMRHSTVFRIEVERIRLIEPAATDRLARLTDEIAQNAEAKDFELVLSLAILQRRLSQIEAFERTVGMWPEIEGILGSLALRDMGCRLEEGQLDLGKISVLEAELAARTAWSQGFKASGKLLGRLAAAERFQKPLILYVAALATADISPAEAVSLLVKAAELQNEKPSERLSIGANVIAEQACRLVCSLYADGRYEARAVRGVLEDCRQISGGWTDEELDYCYATAVGEAGDREKATELLRKIAESPQARRRYRARLDLIKNRLVDVHGSKQMKTGIIEELRDLLDDCTEEDDAGVRGEAMRMYCEIVLESQGRAEAQKVLGLLSEAELGNDPNLNVFKSKALRHLDRPAESAECLAAICETANAEHVVEAAKVLEVTLGQIEELTAGSADSAKLVGNCLAVARYCQGVAQSSGGLIPVDQARLYVAEMLILGAGANRLKPAQAGRLLDEVSEENKQGNPDYLRCHARLSMQLGGFSEAATLWAKVARIEKGRPVAAGCRTWQWWRAAYYRLYCFSKMPQTRAKDVQHNIEVLLNSFADIPTLWAERLNLLAEQCRESDDIAGGL